MVSVNKYYRNQVFISSIEPGALWFSPDGVMAQLVDVDQSLVVNLDHRFKQEPH